MSTEPDYADYGKGRELRELADDLLDTRVRLARAADAVCQAISELDRIAAVVAALAAERRREP